MAMMPDDEAAASMFLLADDDLTSRSDVAADRESAPAESTVREVLNLTAMPDESNLEKRNRGAKLEAAASATEEDTSKAAMALLAKYRRPKR
jgi:hypothetical protein